MELTKEQIDYIEEKHNVYVDAETLQFNVGGGYDAVSGWYPLPQEWIDDAASL